MAAVLFPAQIHAILLDIEGTTTPADFVYGTLFPFARARVEEFLAQHYKDDDVAAYLEALKQERVIEAERIADPPPWREDSPMARIQSAAAYVRWLIDRDRKSTPLKSLQGKIWEAGYRSGELRGQVYPDVAPALPRWCAQQRRIAIFSSGSVLAQRLLFSHSTAGDLTPYISSYFDTTIGPKQEEESYLRIAAALGLPPAEILFLSDVVAELDAGRRTRMHTALCARPDSPAPTGTSHPTVETFDEVFPYGASRLQNCG